MVMATETSNKFQSTPNIVSLSVQLYLGNYIIS